MQKHYRILSPDGFDIEHDRTYTQEEVPEAIEHFIARYKAQGYYSTSNREHIPIEDIEENMQVVDEDLTEYIK